jgi:hypothetical protein
MEERRFYIQGTERERRHNTEATEISAREDRDIIKGPGKETRCGENR